MSFHHPQTPQSPSRFSPTTADPNSSITSSVASMTTALPTPAHSVNGSLSTQPSELPQDMAVAMDHGTPGKRKRTVEDVGDRAAKKAMADDARRLKSLHMDVGPLYMFGKTERPRPSLNTADDLFKTCGLAHIAAKVARSDEKGEKRALRKSYKGHFKNLNLDGHWEPSKKEDSDPDHLFSLMSVPELEWGVHFVKDSRVECGMSRDARQRLGLAASMNKGSVQSVWNTSVLGELSSSKMAAPSFRVGGEASPGTPGPMVGTPGHGAISRSNGQHQHPRGAGSMTAASAALDPARQRKGIKKRAYGDTSYEGYGEGFDDDTGVETGYSTAEGDERAPTQKRRKKNPGAPSPFSTGVRSGYGPSMVGA